MLAQTCPQLPAVESHDTGPHYKHWARLRLLIDDDVTAWHSDSWLQLTGQKATRRRAPSPGDAGQWRVIVMCDWVRAHIFKRLWNSSRKVHMFFRELRLNRRLGRGRVGLQLSTTGSDKYCVASAWNLHFPGRWLLVWVSALWELVVYSWRFGTDSLNLDLEDGDSKCLRNVYIIY